MNAYNVFLFFKINLIALNAYRLRTVTRKLLLCLTPELELDGGKILASVWR